MDALMFKKMKLKPLCTAMVLYAPAEYPQIVEVNWQDKGQADFVHLFVESRQQFLSRFGQAAAVCKENGLFWLSYPKSTAKKIYDINRDSLWPLLLAENYHPVSQIALDDHWSALRVKKNEAGALYEPPNNVKK